ncbi:MAG: hypothetical protein CBC00_01370 [Verrucomicrobia bacterium TMED40]|nr:MAG: hypothetical protein CBC00_01370 [Verrucomicrobia bacterium TMED40]|tara:strand:+ start:1216 stop:1557 length:342 start_codon:yes stop_codon:yes gene_type:complete
MNDDAKFFFCLGGFVGFLLFFSISFALHGNATFALLLGALGCLLISMSFRFLLGLVLRGNQILKVDRSDQQKKGGSSEIVSKSTKKLIDPAEIAAQAMSEAATTTKPLVETKA